MPSAASRERAGYPQPYSRNDLIASRQYADLATMTEVARSSIDGRPIGNDPIRRRGPSIHEKRLAPKEVEFEIAARTLVRLGYRDLRFQTGERPDWRVDLGDGPIGIEVTEVNPSADLTNRVDDLEVELQDAVDAGALCADRYVSTYFGPLAFVYDDVPAKALNARARRDLRDEMLSWLASGTVVSGRIAGYPALERFQITANAGNSPDGGWFELGLGANTFSPMGAVRPTVVRVAKKLEKARGYEHGLPLWLILAITDLRGDFASSIAALGEMQLNLGLFERVIVSDGTTIRTLERPT